MAFGAQAPQTLAERWNGVQWRIQPTPVLPGVFDLSNFSVACPARSACIAAGGFETTAQARRGLPNSGGQPGRPMVKSHRPTRRRRRTAASLAASAQPSAKASRSGRQQHTSSRCSETLHRDSLGPHPGSNESIPYVAQPDRARRWACVGVLANRRGDCDEQKPGSKNHEMPYAPQDDRRGQALVRHRRTPARNPPRPVPAGRRPEGMLVRFPP